MEAPEPRDSAAPSDWVRIAGRARSGTSILLVGLAGLVPLAATIVLVFRVERFLLCLFVYFWLGLAIAAALEVRVFQVLESRALRPRARRSIVVGLISLLLCPLVAAILMVGMFLVVAITGTPERASVSALAMFIVLWAVPTGAYLVSAGATVWAHRNRE
jgi:hypothetical protein